MPRGGAPMDAARNTTRTLTRAGADAWCERGNVAWARACGLGAGTKPGRWHVAWAWARGLGVGAWRTRGGCRVVADARPGAYDQLYSSPDFPGARKRGFGRPNHEFLAFVSP